MVGVPSSMFLVSPSRESRDSLALPSILSRVYPVYPGYILKITRCVPGRPTGFSRTLRFVFHTVSYRTTSDTNDHTDMANSHIRQWEKRREAIMFHAYVISHSQITTSKRHAELSQRVRVRLLSQRSQIEKDPSCDSWYHSRQSPGR